MCHRLSLVEKVTGRVPDFGRRRCDEISRLHANCRNTLCLMARHWLQQEQPDPVCGALVSFLRINTERSQRPY